MAITAGFTSGGSRNHVVNLLHPECSEFDMLSIKSKKIISQDNINFFYVIYLKIIWIFRAKIGEVF